MGAKNRTNGTKKSVTRVKHKEHTRYLGACLTNIIDDEN